jgi:hypothetical protein
MDEDADVRLRGHKGPRRSVRLMLSPLGFRRARNEERIHALGRFYIGGVAYCVWALPPSVEELPKSVYRFIATRPLRYNVKATFGAVIWGLDHGVGPPSSRLRRPKHFRQEACMDSFVMWSTPQWPTR